MSFASYRNLLSYQCLQHWYPLVVGSYLPPILLLFECSDVSLFLISNDALDVKSTTKVVSASSSDKRASLQRANTLEIFDEDANTESPTVSQRSNDVEDIGALLCLYFFIYLHLS